MKHKLVGLFICTLLFTTILPVSGNILLEKTSNPTSIGNKLYVGGSGPNNYTSIQDAINDSVNDDTVFVYDDSSPYYENLLVKKSIIIQGENKYTTIIDGSNNSHGINIIADDVTVTGFTIQNCSGRLFTLISGILLSSNNNKIMDNIILQNQYGISNIIKFNSLPMNIRDNTITNNQIIHNYHGIYLVNISNVTISRNNISQNDEGIMLIGVITTNISFNIISQNEGGIAIIYSYNAVIYRNNISYNNGGVLTGVTSSNKILKNNFIGNKKLSAITVQRLALIMYIIYLKYYLQVPIHRNVWNGNYWNKPRSLPYIIPEFLSLRFKVDWNPAQEPYEI
jgi:parallel beta-helix repeat protein